MELSNDVIDDRPVTLRLREAPEAGAPDLRALDLARRLRALAAERQRLLAKLGPRGRSDPAVCELDTVLERAVADAEDQCRAVFHDPWQAAAALEARTVPPAPRHAESRQCASAASIPRVRTPRLAS